MNTVTPELDNKQVAQPSAFLAGSKDPVLQYGAGRDMIENMKPHLADLRFTTIVEGAGHWVQNERPDDVTHEILRFLKLVR
jgi:pimeloyl-ACP methyl ester carboxylesterase